MICTKLLLHCKYERIASGGKSGSSPDDASVISRVAKAFCGLDSSMEEAMLTKEASIICLRVTDSLSLFVIANEDDDVEPSWRRLFNDIAVKDEGWNANIPPDMEERTTVSIAIFMVENIKSSKIQSVKVFLQGYLRGILPLNSILCMAHISFAT